MNILLINVHSSDNAGDHALTCVAIDQLRNHFPEAHLTIAMDDPDSYTGDEDVIPSLFNYLRNNETPSGLSWKLLRLLFVLPCSLIPLVSTLLFGRPFFAITPPALRKLLQVYINSDLVVSKPGGFLYSSGLGLTLLVNTYSMLLATIVGKPLYLFPQSIGPLRKIWECRLLKYVLMRARVVMLREDLSARQLEDCGIQHPRCHLLPDMAFAYSGGSSLSASTWLQSLGIDTQYDRPLLGLTAINWEMQKHEFPHQSRYEASLVAASRYFIDTLNGTVILFNQVTGPSVAQDDRVPARRILEGLSNQKSRVLFVNDPIKPNLLKAAYGLMDAFIGTRMHSNIFALSQSVPDIAISYQPKTRGIMHMLELDRWLVDIDQVNPEILTELIAKLWEDKEKIQTHLNKKLPEVVSLVELAGALIQEDYRRLKDSINETQV